MSYHERSIEGRFTNMSALLYAASMMILFPEQLAALMYCPKE